MLTKVETIRSNLEASYDPEYYASLWEQQYYSFGQKTPGAPPSSGGKMPIWPNVRPKFVETGTSRRIMIGALISLARNMGSDIVPGIEDVDEWTAEVRRQFWRSRYRGDTQDGEWMHEFDFAYVDLDTLGSCAVEFGAERSPTSGKQKIACRHVPVLQFGWDAHERNPAKSRYMWSVDYLPREEAEYVYGEKAVKGHVIKNADSSSAHYRESVRVIRYYDIGIAGGEPTWAEFIGDWDTKPVRKKRNPFGAILPYAVGVHFLPPQMQKPVGRAMLLMGTQEWLNEIERAVMRRVRRGGHVDLIRSGAINEEDLADWDDGEIDRLRIEGPLDESAFQRLSAQGVEDGLLNAYAMASRQAVQESGQSEMDFATTDSKKGTTLGELEMVQAKAHANSSYIVRQTHLFLRRAVEKFFDLSMIVDEHPTEIDVFGRSYLINDPDEPDTWIEPWLEEPGKVLIDRDSVTTEDDTYRMQMRLQALSVLPKMGLVGKYVKPKWFAENILRAIGEDDTSAAMMDETSVQDEPGAVAPTQDDLAGQPTGLPA